MRDFNDKDRTKKGGRITLPENPGNLSPEKLEKLESAVREKTVDNHISCPSAWRIAEEEGVGKLDVGVTIDRLGIRITDCQLGCFKVEKTGNAGATGPSPVEDLVRRIEELAASGELTCARLERLASDLGVKPLALAEVANAQGVKIRHCQLGCF